MKFTLVHGLDRMVKSTLSYCSDQAKILHCNFYITCVVKKFGGAKTGWGGHQVLQCLDPPLVERPYEHYAVVAETERCYARRRWLIIGLRILHIGSKNTTSLHSLRQCVVGSFIAKITSQQKTETDVSLLLQQKGHCCDSCLCPANNIKTIVFKPKNRDQST